MGMSWSVHHRLHHYLGNESCPVVQPAARVPSFHTPFEWRCGNMSALPHLKLYPSDMKAFCGRASAEGRTFRVWFGDAEDGAVFDSATFTKVRHVRDKCGVLLPLNLRRHWGFGDPRKLRTVPWEQKRDAVVWRGTTTGTGLRRDFVRELHGEHDVCFDNVAQGRHDWIANASSHLCARMSVREQLGYKYLLVLPGNDVATALKWSLASNSVVLMPTPVKETWLMEGLLRAWVHFVPVESPRDLRGALAWLRAHDAQAQAIVKRANAFIDPILAELLTPVPPLFRAMAARVQAARLRRRP